MVLFSRLLKIKPIKKGLKHQHSFFYTQATPKTKKKSISDNNRFKSTLKARMVFISPNFSAFPTSRLSGSSLSPNHFTFRSINHMPKPRYRLYREHKLVSNFATNLEKFIAEADFTDSKQVAEVKKRLEGIIGLMKGHAEHEEKAIHPLLKAKGSKLIEQIEKEHRDHAPMFADLNKRLAEIEATNDSNQLVDLGHHFYLTYRKFVAANLAHINEEEEVIMPELQRLYTDKELKEAIEYKTYEKMTSQEMVHMMQMLFPLMNLDDKEQFLRDIQESQPQKFIEAWRGIAPTLGEGDRKKLIDILNIKVENAPTAAGPQTLRYSWESTFEGDKRTVVKSQHERDNVTGGVTPSNLANKNSASLTPFYETISKYRTPLIALATAVIAGAGFAIYRARSNL